MRPFDLLTFFDNGNIVPPFSEGLNSHEPAILAHSPNPAVVALAVLVSNVSPIQRQSRVIF